MSFLLPASEYQTKFSPKLSESLLIHKSEVIFHSPYRHIYFALKMYLAEPNV